MGVSVPMEAIKRKIYLIRGQKVLLVSVLADLYGIETKNLNRTVKRILKPISAGFMFQLTSEESKGLRFRIGTSNEAGRGGSSHKPYVFTEQGTAGTRQTGRNQQTVTFTDRNRKTPRYGRDTYCNSPHT
jgi:hypothetical protein